jgi:deoxyribose-phosphate aldolase
MFYSGGSCDGWTVFAHALECLTPGCFPPQVIPAALAAAHAFGLLVKVIAETCYLDSAQRLAALRLCEAAGADFIKTSTGFGTAGAVPEHLREWAAARTGRIGLKASGGIKTLAHAQTFLAAGASRLGTSNAVAILAELQGAPATVGAPY